MFVLFELLPGPWLCRGSNVSDCRCASMSFVLWSKPLFSGCGHEMLVLTRSNAHPLLEIKRCALFDCDKQRQVGFTIHSASIRPLTYA